MTLLRWSRTRGGLIAVIAGVLLTGGCTRTGSQHVPGSGAVVAGQATATATARPAADGVQQVVVDATDDNRFKPDVVLAHPGKLRITVTNPSAVPVDFAVPALGVHSATIFSGQTATVNVDVTAVGSYQFVCTFHEHDGMVGDLVVS
jgi:plastocyanin